MIVIIDYNMGNPGSIANMIKKIGYESIITQDIKIIKRAEKIILPGVGSFDKGVYNLKNLNLWDILNYKVIEEKTPILGICLGMQLMTEKSEEGNEQGFGWIHSETIKFKFNGNHLKIPHMGWNNIKLVKDSKLFKNIENQENRFYFVHSYHVVSKNQEDILTTTYYGYDFVSSFEKDNIIGVQFHPEKSHKYGLSLLKNYLEIYES